MRDIGTPGTAIGQVDEPVGMAFNPLSGELYVAEAWNQRIQVFAADGTPLRAFNVNMWYRNRESFNRPFLAVSPDGTLIYATDMDSRRRVVAYNLSGMPIISFNQPELPESSMVGMRNPAGVAVDSTGRVYVVDSSQALVYVFPATELAGGIPPLPSGDLSGDLSGEVSDPNAAPLDAGDQGASDVSSEISGDASGEVSGDVIEATCADASEDTGASGAEINGDTGESVSE